MKINKRSHSTLGRSPDEKVKGHSGAIYRGPPMLHTKYQSSSRFLQKKIQCKFVTPDGIYFYPRGIIWTILGEDL